MAACVDGIELGDQCPLLEEEVAQPSRPFLRRGVVAVAGTALGLVAAAAAIGLSPKSFREFKFSIDGLQEKQEQPRELGAMCNEVKYQGLCYRTCQNMGEMEPRKAGNNCGGIHSEKFASACKSATEPYPASALPPGSGGRPEGGCFGTDQFMEVKDPKDAPNVCQDKTTMISGKNEWKCTNDGEPTVTKEFSKKHAGDVTTCECPLPARGIHRKRKSIFVTTNRDRCNTGCKNSKGYLVVDGIAYCCPGDEKPSLDRKTKANGDISVTCMCPSR